MNPVIRLPGDNPADRASPRLPEVTNEVQSIRPGLTDVWLRDVGEVLCSVENGIRYAGAVVVTLGRTVWS